MLTVGKYSIWIKKISLRNWSQSIVENLVEQCDGHALALVLVASAVKRSAELRKRDEPGAAEWRSVLHDMARLRDTSDDEAPMRAYTIAVGRQSELGKSIMSTLCLFPGGCRAPVDMVREIWLANQRGIWHVCRRAVRAIWRAVWPVSLWPSPVGDAAAEFDAALDALAKARIVNLLKSTSGAAHDGAPRPSADKLAYWRPVRPSRSGAAFAHETCQGHARRSSIPLICFRHSASALPS